MSKPRKAPKRAKQLTKGHQRTKLDKYEKPSWKKGKITKRMERCRQVVREVCGFAPYEKKMLDFLRSGGASEAKKALKLAKRRLGTHRRGMLKRSYLEEIVQKERSK